ncbi:MAG: hypothetical protein AAGI38_18190 [Bacteroidota bacterium]
MSELHHFKRIDIEPFARMWIDRMDQRDKADTLRVLSLLEAGRSGDPSLKLERKPAPTGKTFVAHINDHYRMVFDLERDNRAKVWVIFSEPARASMQQASRH